ncbi:DUF2777 domain-containing protein [Peribacillus saganii]|uniref:DUF2777 domain-containing protein n=1 Tax=Peribacillus saganii TaxID=2303992 RepID=A0A372LLY3_9BACI|nr:DUF2777 domain-containing protein [Peribacillus saganii]RFU68067.1 DUF2777 domain-containing protein [Peribacillus saganii]
MNKQQRATLLNHQSRAYTEGIVDYINEQWVFFDEETDEAYSMEDYVNHDIEIYRGNRWRKGVLGENGLVALGKTNVYLMEKEQIRIRKQLLYSFERLLDEINDDSFFQFVTTLNSLDFSVYDSIYCYNQLTFLRDLSAQSGVNFLIFDNGTQICSVQHHFCYSKNEQNRFEFTINTGKRIVIEKLNSHP